MTDGDEEWSTVLESGGHVMRARSSNPVQRSESDTMKVLAVA